MKKKFIVPFVSLLFLGSYLVFEDMGFLIFPNSNASNHGEIVTAPDEELSECINKFFEKHHNKKDKGEYFCDHKFIGRDNKYAYIDLACGAIESKYGKLKLAHGYSSPTRVRVVAGCNILGFKQPIEGEAFSASLAWIFPKKIADYFFEQNRPGIDMYSKIHDRQFDIINL